MDKRPAAFTLIELLVVISIVSLLIAILLPALRSARRTSRDAQCLSNIRQIGIAVYAYANIFNDYMVPRNFDKASAYQLDSGYANTMTAHTSDTILLGQFTQNTGSNGPTRYGRVENDIWLCPNFNGPSRYGQWGNARADYSLETYTYAQITTFTGWSEMWRIADAIKPSKLLMFADGDVESWFAGWESSSAKPFYGITDGTASESGSWSMGAMLYIRNRRLRHANNAATNFNFIDGHARTIKNPAQEYANDTITLDVN